MNEPRHEGRVVFGKRVAGGDGANTIKNSFQHNVVALTHCLLEDSGQSTQNSLQERFHNFHLRLICNTPLEIDDTECGFVLDFWHGVAESFVNELKYHASEVNLDLWSKFIGHVSHSDKDIINDARIL